MARVLVVDDDRAALEIRKLLLERAGHVVETASNVDEARAAGPFDWAILDMRIPEPEDGLSLIREFQASGARVIVLCGNRADLDGQPEAGLVAAVIEKPARSELLLKAIAGSPASNGAGEFLKDFSNSGRK